MTYVAAMRILLARYLSMTDDRSKPFEGLQVPEALTVDRARSMLQALQDNLETWPEDKSSRWLGYVQAILVLHRLTTVEIERDVSRPLFHDLYRSRGLAPPVTTDLR